MKKGILFAGLAAFALLVTGCDVMEGDVQKKLHCTMSEDAGGATTTSTMDVNFDGDKAEDITMEIVIEYTDDYASFADVFKQTLESQRGNLEDIGYEVTITSGDNSQKLRAYGTYDSLDASEANGTYEATKKSFEDSGYTCK